MSLSRRRLLATAGATALGAALAPAWRPVRADPLAAAALDRFRALCRETALSNVIDGRPIPSHAYQHATWLRDGFWTMAALGDRELQLHNWRRFAREQNVAIGQVPTALLHTDEVYYTVDDESTAFFVLLALELRRAGRPVERTPLEHAARYLERRVTATGAFETGPGPFSWWVDTLILAHRDTVAYTQGITAVALRALLELEIPVSPAVVERVEATYRGLYRPDLGVVTLSARTTLLDVSSLVGEHLSWRYFRRPLLSTESVASTLGAFRQVFDFHGRFLGFPVLSQLSGDYLPAEWFWEAPDNWPGHYHNGGSWLLYDALALDAGRRHGVPWAEDYLYARVAAETRHAETLHEYIATDPDLADFGQAPFPWRTGYAWNSYVATLIGSG